MESICCGRQRLGHQHVVPHRDHVGPGSAHQVGEDVGRERDLRCLHLAVAGGRDHLAALLGQTGDLAPLEDPDPEALRSRRPVPTRVGPGSPVPCRAARAVRPGRSVSAPPPACAGRPRARCRRRTPCPAPRSGRARRPATARRRRSAHRCAPTARRSRTGRWSPRSHRGSRRPGAAGSASRRRTGRRRWADRGSGWRTRSRRCVPWRPSRSARPPRGPRRATGPPPWPAARSRAR